MSINYFNDSRAMISNMDRTSHSAACACSKPLPKLRVVERCLVAKPLKKLFPWDFGQNGYCEAWAGLELQRMERMAGSCLLQEPRQKSPLEHGQNELLYRLGRIGATADGADCSSPLSNLPVGSWTVWAGSESFAVDTTGLIARKVLLDTLAKPQQKFCVCILA